MKASTHSPVSRAWLNFSGQQSHCTSPRKKSHGNKSANKHFTQDYRNSSMGLISRIQNNMIGSYSPRNSPSFSLNKNMRYEAEFEDRLMVSQKKTLFSKRNYASENQYIGVNKKIKMGYLANHLLSPIIEEDNSTYSQSASSSPQKRMLSPIYEDGDEEDNMAFGSHERMFACEEEVMLNIPTSAPKHFTFSTSDLQASVKEQLKDVNYRE